MPTATDLLKVLQILPLPAREILQRLAITQPTLSRWAAELGENVVRYGRARQSAYAARRRVMGQSQFPLYQISRDGQVQEQGVLFPVQPCGYVVQWSDTALAAGQSFYTAGLPWWLADMRPQGFLGRAFVHQYAPRLGLPADLSLWSDDQVLIALAQLGEDCAGNWLVGDAALSRLLNPPVSDALLPDERVQQYPVLAAQALGQERVGSSAGGEQPKFTATLKQANNDAESIHVLVKFTAPADNAVTRRWASLLLAEHLALQTLQAAGFAAATSQFFNIEGQSFLEVQRFDRTSMGGRIGLVSLAAVDHAFTGQADANWAVLAQALQRLKQISAEDAATMQRLYAFGCMIANSDMHLGNLAFFHEQTSQLRLAPVYDMLPMQFAPRASGLIPQDVSALRVATPPALVYWQEMLPLAQQFWQRVMDTPQPDPSFPMLASACWQRLQDMRSRFALD